MIGRAALLATTLALAPLAPTASASSTMQGLTCGLASTTAGEADQQSGVVTGGPMAVTGEIALVVIYTCTLRVVSTGEQQTVRSESSGPVGVVRPTPVTFRADPATERVELCTQVEWIFGFPGGGAVDFGCREATARTDGYEVGPDVEV